MVAERPNLGTKLTCGACAVRFYDLGRAPAVCPVCGAEQAPPKPRVQGYRAGPRTPGAPFGRGWTQRRPAAAVPDAVADDDAAPLLETADDDEAEEVEDDDLPDDAVEIPEPGEDLPDA